MAVGGSAGQQHARHVACGRIYFRIMWTHPFQGQACGTRSHGGSSWPALLVREQPASRNP
eukprot:scaffold13082_cov80-Isochrysis_galbana.AAC.3